MTRKELKKSLMLFASVKLWCSYKTSNLPRFRTEALILNQIKTLNPERFLAFENLKLDFFNLKNIKLNWCFAAKH